MEAYFNVVSKRKQDDKNITVSKSTDVEGESQTPTNLRRVASSVKICEESVADLNGHESTSAQKGRVKAYANELPCPLDVTKMLLSSLSDPSNPITHSNIADRTDHYVAFATGHQVVDERVNQRLYHTHHEEKLRKQREISGDNNLLRDVRVYIDGYLESTTDIEMKRLVVEAGGQIVPIASQCTHIVTSRGLSGSKTHRLLTQKRCKIHVVKPEWVLDSLAIGKRRPERSYAIVKPANTLEDFLKA